jgi:branched-chain amino acid transport system ATP-binding protein
MAAYQTSPTERSSATPDRHVNVLSTNSSGSMTDRLDARGLTFSYGAARALETFSLSVEPGEIVALIGSNGAGKSTTAKIIAGALKPQSGEVNFGDVRLSGLPSYRVMRHGVILVPEGRLVFSQMTVEDTLLMGAYPERDREVVTRLLKETYVLFPRLLERKKQLAGSLSGGEQQMLAIGRGLMGQPKLLVLDEPSLGLMPKLVLDLFRLIERIAASGISVLLIEQNARASLQISNRTYVLEKGKLILQGASRDLLKNDFVRNAYLGGDL